MRQDRKNSKKTSNKPAAALALCFCLMALVSIFAVKNSIDKIKNSMDTENVIKKQSVETPKPETSETAEILDSLDTENETDFNTHSNPDFIYPLEGKILTDYSMDMPIYWKTLDQYMTHPGIDIAAEKGTPVQASSSGTVTKIEEDTAMGVTVEINHGNGLISVYSNLASDGLIELGEVVTRGQVIGKVGQSSMFEFDSPGHLHFEIRRGEDPVDPLSYIKP